MTEEQEKQAYQGGAERTGRRPSYHLVPKELMAAVADARAEGDRKYEPNNWMKGDREFFVDCLGHAVDHLMDCAWDEHEDMELHLGHAATNIGFILWALKRNMVARADFQNAALIVQSPEAFTARERLVEAASKVI